MLDAFIIEELRRREEAEKRKQERPRLELPLHDGSSYGRTEPSRDADAEEEPKSHRGVIIIEY
jgi:hypothetical protein